MPPKILIDPVILKDLYINKHFSANKCAGILECSHMAVLRALAEYKIPKHVYGKGKRKRTVIERDVLIDLYQNKKLTMKECAHVLGLTHNIVHLGLLDYGIPIRNPMHARIYNIPKEWLEENYVNNGLSLEDCALLIGCTHHTIASELQRNGISQVRRSSAGENNPNWRGGRSYEPYCPAFTNELREEIRGKFNRTCYLCPTTEKDNKRRLSVHHVDYQKSQGCKGQKWGLLPLCCGCHAKTNINRWYWFALLRDYWLNDYINFFSLQGGI